MKPREAETFDQICAIDRDNTEVGDYWILIDEANVYLREQAKGESPTASIELPREVFNAFVDWYERGVVPKTDKRKNWRDNS
jgi:hypothetical protein